MIRDDGAAARRWAPATAGGAGPVAAGNRHPRVRERGAQTAGLSTAGVVEDKTLHDAAGINPKTAAALVPAPRAESRPPGGGDATVTALAHSAQPDAPAEV